MPCENGGEPVRARLALQALDEWTQLLEPGKISAVLRDIIRRLRASGGWLETTHWRTCGKARMYGSPWPSLTTLDRPARAVAVHGTGITDFDVANCHATLALLLGEILVAMGLLAPDALKTLRRYVEHRSAIIRSVANVADVPETEVKTLFCSLLNGGDIQTWRHNTRAAFLPLTVLADLRAFRACTKKIRTLFVALVRRDSAFVAHGFPRHILETKDDPSVWSYILFMLEDRVVAILTAVVRRVGGEVVSFQYDGVMAIMSAYGSRVITETARAERVAAVARVSSCIASFAICPLSIRPKPLPLPPRYAQHLEIRQLRARVAYLEKRQCECSDAHPHPAKRMRI